MIVKVQEYVGTFAEDKDVAKMIRQEHILPSIAAHQEITIDFTGVQSSTQSFVHALISKALQENGEAVLQKILFSNCSDKVKRLITMVTNYSLE